MRWIGLATLFFPAIGWVQINFQLGQSINLGNKCKSYEVNYDDYIGTYDSDFRKFGTETFFKLGSYKPWDTSRFSVNYTLEFGLKYCHYTVSSSHLLKVENDYEEPYFGVGASSYYQRKISFMQGVDFIYRINKRYTFIHTLGIKLGAINKSRREILWGQGSSIGVNVIENKPLINPIISLVIAPQLLIHCKRLSIGFHLNQDISIFNNLINSMNESIPDLGKVQMSTYSSFGISIMPNFYLVPVEESIDVGI